MKLKVGDKVEITSEYEYKLWHGLRGTVTSIPEGGNIFYEITLSLQGFTVGGLRFDNYHLKLINYKNNNLTRIVYPEHKIVDNKLEIL